MALQQKDSLWILPDELLLEFMRTLHVKDLLNMRSTHPYLRDIIDDNESIWSSVSFCDTWPTHMNIKHFNKAAKNGNIECLIKLGLAYLYNEGLPSDMSDTLEKAALMFFQVEALTPHTSPFSWLFIRPPWAAAGACCKECVFNNMKAFVAKHPDPSIHVCIGKTLQLLEDGGQRVEEMLHHLTQAAHLNSPTASFLLWQHNHNNAAKENDHTSSLHSLRELRQVASLGHLDAQLELCRQYCQGSYGGISRVQAVTFVRQFVQASRPTNVLSIYSFQQLTHSMRYILVDWLVEVTSIKELSTQTLHVAVDIVDRYINVRNIQRSKLQLLGVAAMALCSRLYDGEFLTIQEAVWMTDNTYQYDEVVHMMGEITAALKGNFRNVLSLDYTEVFGLLAHNDVTTQWQAQYMCELALLQSEMGAYPTAMLAASVILLARLAQKKDVPWPSQMVEFTGYDLDDLSSCALHLNDLCFVEPAMFDHRDVELQAVKLRYQEEDKCMVSTLPVLGEGELLELLDMEMVVIEDGAVVDREWSEAMADSLSENMLITPSSKKSKEEKYTSTELSGTQTSTLQVDNDSGINEDLENMNFSGSDRRPGFHMKDILSETQNSESNFEGPERDYSFGDDSDMKQGPNYRNMDVQETERKLGQVKRKSTRLMGNDRKTRVTHSTTH